MWSDRTHKSPHPCPTGPGSQGLGSRAPQRQRTGVGEVIAGSPGRKRPRLGTREPRPDLTPQGAAFAALDRPAPALGRGVLSPRGCHRDDVGAINSAQKAETASGSCAPPSSNPALRELMWPAGGPPGGQPGQPEGGPRRPLAPRSSS